MIKFDSVLKIAGDAFEVRDDGRILILKRGEVMVLGKKIHVEMGDIIEVKKGEIYRNDIKHEEKK